MCSVLNLASLCGRVSNESSHGCYLLRNSCWYAVSRTFASSRWSVQEKSSPYGLSSRQPHPICVPGRMVACNWGYQHEINWYDLDDTEFRKFSVNNTFNTNWKHLFLRSLVLVIENISSTSATSASCYTQFRLARFHHSPSVWLSDRNSETRRCHIGSGPAGVVLVRRGEASFWKNAEKTDRKTEASWCLHKFDHFCLLHFTTRKYS